MRKLAYAVLFGLCCAGLMSAQDGQLKKSRVYQWPVKNATSYDSVLAGLEGVRCVAVGDLNNDGKPEIVATNYTDNGHVHVFSLAGKDTFELVWSSPTVDTTGGNSSPRNVVIGDLDNDGRNEVIFERTWRGVYVYEWDGQTGCNLGTTYSQLVNWNSCPGYPWPVGSGTGNYTEKISVADVDGDGQQELVMSYRSASSGEQKYMIIGAVGDWATDSPGFSGFTFEYVGARNDLTDWGLNLGSAIAMVPGNLDGTGAQEVILDCYNFQTLSVLSYNGSAWSLPDVGSGMTSIQTLAADGVSYFGGMAFDVDKDGRDEIYLPHNVFSDTADGGIVDMIYYNSPATANTISSSNLFKLDLKSVVGTTAMWGYGYGDWDGNGKQNVYFTTASPGKAIVTAEFQGGDKTNMANWVVSSIYYGDTTTHAITLKDSSGVIDTVSLTNEFYFPSKIYAHGTDLDGDGVEDIVAGFQPWNYGAPGSDSIAVTKFTWNGSAYDSTNYKIQNNKRYSFVMLSKGVTTGLVEHNLVFITPDDYTLQQNYPNPFNPSTTISFTLPLNKQVTAKVYDMLGKEVSTLLNNEQLAKGTHSLIWNGVDNSGRHVASGTYIFRMTAGSVVKSMKMMLVK